MSASTGDRELFERLLGAGEPSPQADPAPLDRARVAAFVVRMSEHRAAGDIDGMLAHVADDIVCHTPPTWSQSLFPATVRGKAALRQGLLERYIQYIFLPSQVHKVLIDGDRAVVHRTTALRSRGGGEMLNFDVVDFLRFRGGLVSEFTEFPDGGARNRIGGFPR